MNLRKRMKKNAKWRPSDEMIKKELAEIGRGPRDYARAKEEAINCGIEFLDEYCDEVQGSHRKKSLSDQPFLEPNLGMKLNQAKKRKREAQVSSWEGRSSEVSLSAHAAKKQRLRESDPALEERKTMQGSKLDRAHEEGYQASASTPNKGGIEHHWKLEMVEPCMPSSEAIESNVGHEGERERFDTKLDEVKRAAGSGSGVDISQAGKAQNLGSGVPPAATVDSGLNKSVTLWKPPPAARSRVDSTAHAKTVVPVDLTEMSPTNSDASSATSTEGHKMSAGPTSLDESPWSESSAESSPGDGSLLLLERKVLDKPPIFCDPGLDDSSAMVDDADIGMTPGGDHSLMATSATSTDNIIAGKLGLTRTSSPQKRDRDHAYIITPKDDTRAVLVNPATTFTLTHGPASSRTHLIRQARGIVNAAVTRAAELRDAVVVNAEKELHEKCPPDPTSVFLSPAAQLGNAQVLNVPKAAIPRLHHPSEDQTLSKSTHVGKQEMVSTRALLHGSVSSRPAQNQCRCKLEQTVETAVTKASELGGPVLSDAIRKLYEPSLCNPAIANLLTAILILKAAEYASRIKAARNQHSEHQTFQKPPSEANVPVLPGFNLSLNSCAPGLAHRNIPSISSGNSSVRSVLSSAAGPIPPFSSTSASSNTQLPSTGEFLNAYHTGISRSEPGNAGLMASNTPSITIDYSNITSSTAASVAPSNITANSSGSQSPSAVIPTNPPKPITLPQPSRPRVSIIVPGGSGVMAFNRERRRARISASANGNADVRHHTSESSNARHQRLRDFVVNGKVR